MLRIISAKVTASPGKTGWVQIHGFSPSDPDKIIKRGQLFVALSSRDGREGIEAIAFERELVGKLSEEYYASADSKAFDALKNATQKIVAEFSVICPGLEIACCVFSNGVVYSSAFGGGKLVISRDSSLASILESQDVVITASGFPKSGDIIIVGTKSFFEKVSLMKLKDSLSNRNPESAIEELTPIIYGGNEIGTAGAIILKFSEELIIHDALNSEPLKSPVDTKVEEIPQREMNTPTVEQFSKPKIDLGSKVLSIFKTFSNKLPRKNIYIKQGIQDEATSQSKKLTLSVGVVLLIILSVSIIFGIRQKKINMVKKEYQNLLTEAGNEVDQAISLASVNQDQSRQLFLDSETKLARIESLKIKDQKITDLQKKIEESRAAVLGEYVANTELFLDLGLLSSGFNGDSLSSSGGFVYVLDKSGSRAVSIAIDTKKSKVVAGPTVLTSPQGIASYEDNVYVLQQDGIYDVSSGKTKVIDKTWNGDVYIYAFAGNIYVLDKSGNAILRFIGQPGGTFSTGQNWLSTSTKADFSNAVGWGLNGVVYVLYPNAKILRYSLGSPQNFSLSGVNPEIGSVDAIYADSDNQYVYLLDKAGNRVVMIDKNGKYKAQYINDQIGDATSLVVSEADKKMILLTGQKLLSIDLKNI